MPEHMVQRKQGKEGVLVTEKDCCQKEESSQFSRPVTGDNRNQHWSETVPVVSKISNGAFKKSFKLSMDEDSLLRIDCDRRGAKISCAKGAVCVTQHNDVMDHILSDDETLLINRKGRVIAWALLPGYCRSGLSRGRQMLHERTAEVP